MGEEAVGRDVLVDLGLVALRLFLGAADDEGQSLEELQVTCLPACGDDGLTCLGDALAGDLGIRSEDELRFRVARGTLFDVLGAESNYFGIAARYIQTLTELDTARYILLARTGKLLTAIDVKPATLHSQ